MSDPRATPTPAGRRRFYLKQRIGQGAFGEVFLAEQDSGAGFRRPVAIKLLNSEVAGSREAARRMRDEARILGRLHHRNIVGVLDLVRVDQRWAVIMDYVPGADLEQVLHALELTKGLFPPAAAFEVGAAVCRALHAAYHTDDSQGRHLEVVHRDIKPSNVRVTTDGEVKVLDFGVARVNNLETRESATKAGGWIGTERYMAPERLLMEGDTPAGDVYATGASIVELILGRPLGKTPVYDEQHRAFVDDALAEVRARLSGPPDVIDEAISRLDQSLANRPGDRPTAEGLAKAFGGIARRLDGESLAAFCAEFVPKVGNVLGYTAVPVSGVLTESSDLPTSSRGAVGSPAPMTIIPEGDEEGRTFDVSSVFVEGPPASPAPARPTPSMATTEDGPPRRRWLPWAGLALFGAVALAAVAVAMWPEATVEPPPAPASVPVVSTVEPEPPAPQIVVVPVPAPAPEPVVVVAPAPAPRPRPRPAPAPAPAPVPEVVPEGPRVTAALVVMQNAAALEVRCGDRSSVGTASVRIADFPPGPCRVRAQWLGKWLETDVRIDKPREIRCTVAGEALTCS